MEFKEYTNKVIARYGLRGQNAVAREIGITTASMSQFTTGKALPSESTMIKLAELAGLPKEEALIDLNMWRSKDKPELQKVWQRISKMIGALFAACLIPFDCFAASVYQVSSDMSLAEISALSFATAFAVTASYTLCDMRKIMRQHQSLLCDKSMWSCSVFVSSALFYF